MIEKIKYITRHPSEKHSVEQSYPRVQERMQQSLVSDGRRFRLRRLVRVAAIAASVALLVTLGYLMVDKEPEKQTYTFTAQDKNVHFPLPDGTVVWLNINSTLSYTESFNLTTRDVELTGEAYFEVAKNAEKPFVVNMNEGHIEVLGTKFNIRAYPEDGEIISTLTEGSIKYRKTLSDTYGVILHPGQQLSCLRENGDVVIRDVAGLDNISWKDRKIIFRKTPIKEAFTVLEQFYEIKILTVNTLFDDRQITGSFEMNMKPEAIFSVMQESFHFKYEVREDTIVIK